MPEPTLAQEPVDYEIVLGRRQVASVGFVAVVLLVVFSAVSYMAGKAMSRVADKATSTQSAPVESVAHASNAPAVTPPQAPVTPVPATPVLEATIALPPVPVEKIPQAKQDAQEAKRDEQADAPLFADPRIGAVYIQMAAVEKGMAVLLAEGLRTHGLESFVAPGPNERIFRVLIGPLPNPASFTHAKETVDLLGLSTFARKYQK